MSDEVGESRRPEDNNDNNGERGERISCSCHLCHRSFRRCCLQSQQHRQLLEGGWGVGRDVIAVTAIMLQE
jgi:hypothetical protein